MIMRKLCLLDGEIKLSDDHLRNNSNQQNERNYEIDGTGESL